MQSGPNPVSVKPVLFLEDGSQVFGVWVFLFAIL